MKKTFYISLILLIVSCGGNNDEGEHNNTPSSFVFEDSFESANNELSDLLPTDLSRWTNIQQVDPVGATNQISVVSDPVSDGASALQIVSNPSNTILSKIDIEKAGFQAFSGDVVTIKADFYIATENPITDLFLIDLECCSCWDESSGADNQCPGVRLQISGDGFLSIERGKISDTTISQNQVSFPRNQWVTVEWQIQLSDQPDGVNSLKLNNTEVISSTGMNLPNADIFRDLFAEESIDFNLQQPVFYERVQIGATANPTAGLITLYVDNFSIRVK